MGRLLLGDVSLESNMKGNTVLQSGHVVEL